MSETGVIKQIIGAVIDVEFDKDQIPNIYDALVVGENNLVLETQQQLGDGVVRTVAMGTTEGLKRGLDVENTKACLLYTSPSPRDKRQSRMPSSA